ncbi:unnamed protein product [Leptosia nina]|uniref:Uncharacterized protein n=1 Tax=Leptosia nina TaxID=320188 RepID=A0AAV1K3V1_9NEOP
MALNKLCFYALTALLAVNFIFAEEQPQHEERRFPWPNHFSFSFERALNASKGFFPGGLFNNSREFFPRRPESNDPQGPPSRSQRSIRFSGCNFNAEPGLSCLDCTTARLCLPNNVSITANCGFLLPNCNGGRCSASPSSSCNSTRSN